MQSLGKVPSARRPPANLPSLKAETSSPSQDQSGSWAGAPESTNSIPVNEKQNDSAAKLANSGSHSTQSNNSANNTHSNNSIGSNSGSYNNHLSASTNQSSATWSSVTNSKLGGERTPPPSYQSLQFQQEFPSLDGSSAPAQTKGSRGGSGPSSSTAHPNDQSPSKNAEPMQASSSQRSQSDGGNVATNQPDQVLQQIPPQFRNLMPKFMLQGQVGIAPGQNANAMGAGTASTSQYGLPDFQTLMNYQTRENKGRQQYGYDEHRRGDRDRDERSYRRGPPPRVNRHDSYSDAEIEFTSEFVRFFNLTSVVNVLSPSLPQASSERKIWSAWTKL